jgi:molecular chaperone DnaK
MRKDAEAHTEEDRKRRELIEERNKADSLIYSTEKTLKEHGSKIPEADRKKIEEAIAALNKVKAVDNADEIRKRAEDVMNASQVIGKLLYEEAARQRGAASEPGAGPSSPGGAEPRDSARERTGRGSAPKGGPGGDNVVDADFEVLDDDKDKDKDKDKK